MTSRFISSRFPFGHFDSQGGCQEGSETTRPWAVRPIVHMRMGMCARGDEGWNGEIGVNIDWCWPDGIVFCVFRFYESCPGSGVVRTEAEATCTRWLDVAIYVAYVRSRPVQFLAHSCTRWRPSRATLAAAKPMPSRWSCYFGPYKRPITLPCALWDIGGLGTSGEETCS